jgi:DNA-binding transcriptional regulator YiaG
MPNLASALKTEIGRVARKELRRETQSIQRAVAAYRHQIAEMKRRIQALERQHKRVVKSIPARAPEVESTDTPLRFRADGFAQHRKRLGLSAREMGLLLDASPLSVYNWEAGQARPRAKHLVAIAAVRKMGKREASKRLEELGASAAG